MQFIGLLNICSHLPPCMRFIFSTASRLWSGATVEKVPKHHNSKLWIYFKSIYTVRFIIFKIQAVYIIAIQIHAQHLAQREHHNVSHFLYNVYRITLMHGTSHYKLALNFWC